MTLTPPLPLRALLRLALDDEEAEWKPHCGGKDDLTDMAATLLLEKSDMLEEYFGIGLDPGPDARGQLRTLPELLNGYEPSPQALPLFLLRLATETDWEDEQTCFQGVAHELGLFYSHLPCASQSPSLEHREGSGGRKYDAAFMEQVSPEGRDAFVRCVLPALRTHLVAPASCTSDGTVVQIAALEQLYKVFERC